MNYIGAHIPKDKDVINTMEIIRNNGGNILQIFTSSPRSTKLANIESYKKDSKKILEYCKKYNFKLVIHSPYTVNLAKSFKNDNRILDINDCYWINILINELIISDIIGAIGTVVHVGKYTTLTPEEGLNNMIISIKYIIKYMMDNNIKSKLILETPAGQGTELLTNINDYLDFYKNFTKEEKKHLKLCIDTAHIWSSGYTLEEAFNIIMKNNTKDIALIHLNGSKKQKGSKVDVHDHIFEGKIPLIDIEKFLSTYKKCMPPIILEKPSSVINEEFEFIKNIK